jgi:AP2 domain
MPNRKMKYVYRGSRPRGNHGWIAKVRDKPGKFFSDTKYGTKTVALDRATAYAKRLVDRSRINPETGRFLHKDPSSGVFRFVNLRKPGKPAVWIAVASLEPGKPTRRQFSVRKYGEKKAERRARRARAKMVKQILAQSR